MVIKEFLPNPVGNDQEGEYIKVLNDSDSAVNLSGWQIKDAAGKIFRLNNKLAAGQELILPYSQTKISLNNSGEQLFLYDAAGKLVDELSYSGQAGEGQIITRNQKSIISNQQLEFQPNLPISNYQLPISRMLFIDFLTAAILAALVLYLILQLEKKLEIKLF